MNADKLNGVDESSSARRQYRLACPACGWTGPAQLRYRCPSCSSALETEMNLTRAVPIEADQPEVAFADYLPLANVGTPQGGSVRTPCRRAENLGVELGMSDLWLKDETAQPTGSTKDRLASIVVSVYKQFGVTEFVASSTGNTGLALARAVGIAGSMTMHLFCPRSAATINMIDGWAGTVLHPVDGDYSAAIAAAKRFADHHGLQLDAGFFNWARREGLKVSYLEAFIEMPREPEVVLQAISSGMGMMAARKAVIDLRASGHMTTMPALVMVQQDTCAPMVCGWQRGADSLNDSDVIANPEGLGTAILLGDARASYPYMRELARSTGGAMVSVTSAEMIAARDLLRKTESIDACYASSTVVAAVGNLVRRRTVDPAATVLLHITGRERAE